MVFQAYSLFPNMDAADNVEFGLRVRGTAAEGAAAQGRRAHRARRPLSRPRSATRTSSRAGCSSGSRLRERSRSSRASSSSTSRSRHSTRLFACSSARRSAACRRSSGSRRSTSRTTRRRRSRSPTASPSSAGPRRADRVPGRDLQRAADAVRRRVHRHDEPPRVDGHRRRRGRLRGNEAACRQRPRPPERRARARPRPARVARARASRRTGAGLGGEVVGHIFLGSTTRLKVDAAGQELSADVSERAGDLASCRRARQRDVPCRERTGARAGREASVSRRSPGRSLKIPVDSRALRARACARAR